MTTFTSIENALASGQSFTAHVELIKLQDPCANPQMQAWTEGAEGLIDRLDTYFKGKTT